MKYIIFIAFAITISGCNLQKVKKNHTQSRKAPIERVKMSWNTLEEAKLTLESAENPIFVLFSGYGCPGCERLAKLTANNNWDSKILKLNIGEDWVGTLSDKLSVDSIPTFFIFDKKNPENSKKIIGFAAIKVFMFSYFKEG